jgi:hypothetical protein
VLGRMARGEKEREMERDEIVREKVRNERDGGV